MTTETPVLIAGAGPAGLATALTLAGYGVESTLVDRRATPSGLPRATTLSTRSMELVRAWGLADQVLAGGVDVIWRLWVGHTLAARDGQAIPVGLPTPAEAARVSPAAPACVPQDHLEPVLLDRLRSLGTTRVCLGTELVGLAEHGVTTLREENGATRRVRARYLVGADGAHSRVRQLLGIPMAGAGRLGDFISVDFRAPLWELLGPRRYGIYWVEHPAAAGNFLPAGRGDRWRYGLAWDPATESQADYPAQRWVELIRLGAGAPDLTPALGRVDAFEFAALLADRYREGDVFLTGDAAHRVTPRGGTGLNTALADGYDLGWKLAWVLRGWADDSLLDSYQAERRPVGAHNVARSAQPDGSRATLDEALPADLGGRIPHHWLRPGVSTLDVLGPGWTVFTESGPGGYDSPAPAMYDSPAPVTTHRVDRAAAAALRIPPGGALLVRPDGRPADARH